MAEPSGMAEIELMPDGGDYLRTVVGPHEALAVAQSCVDSMGSDYGPVDDWPLDIIGDLAQHVEFVVLREHGDNDGYVGCSCEGSGWWCDEASGPPRLFGAIRQEHIEAASDKAWERVCDAEFFAELLELVCPAIDQQKEATEWRSW